MSHRPPSRPPAPPERLFLAWPSPASLLYLLSAALLLAGAALVLAPGAGDEARLGERLGMIASVLAYQGALLAVVLLVCRWRRAHEDAVALAVLLAAFAGGGAAALDTVAYHQPWAALGLGLAGLGQCLAAGALLPGRVLAAWPAGLPRALAALLAAGHLLPAVLGFHARATDADPELARTCWLWGWAWLLAAAGLLVVLAWRTRPAAAAADGPDGRRRGLAWVLALVAAATTGLHQWYLTYAFGMAVEWGDLAPFFALLLWAGELLAWRWCGDRYRRERTALLAGAAVVLLLAAAPGAARLAPAGIATAPLLLLAGGALLTAAAWRRGHAPSAVLGGLWLALGAVSVGGEQAWAWHPRSAAALSLAVLALEGWRRRSWRLAAVAGALGALGAALPVLPRLPALLAALLPENRGWLAVIAAFALLAAGALASRRAAAGPATHPRRGDGPSGAAAAPSIPTAPASIPVSTEVPCIPPTDSTPAAPPASP